MIKTALITCIAVVMLTGINTATGQKIYLSPAGNDLNDGTRENPVASLTTALDRAREIRKAKTLTEPLEIIVLDGEYFMIQPLELRPEDSGTPSSPLVFRADEDSNPVFLAGVPITGFEKVNDKLWKTFIQQVAYYNSYFEQLYVNGKENIIRNNIFALNIRSQLQATRIEEHRSISFTNNIIYFDKGTLLSSNWHKFNLLSDYNCYWDTRPKDIRFADMSFAEWQKSGKDARSVIADPQFVNPAGFDFILKINLLSGRSGLSRSIIQGQEFMVQRNG